MKLPTLKLNDKIEVHWSDIVATSKWLSHETTINYPAIACSSMGYFLNIKNGCLRLSCSINEDKERDLTVIPIGTVSKVTRLK